ncbi:unnamed protein product [Triticum turgidum subsp. durum]|uniref:Uncharacterized protein n=1 Tax=Triticum turgidum subsp. durum TaxID=4567 RepID=A0A9R0R0C8_TRITD|nr:unnamed protein product [Triticum turgidum subsp. durum]
MEQELRGGGAVRAQSTLCFSGALVDGPRIQQLLLHCAAALESNDVTLAQQAMWIESVVGADGTERSESGARLAERMRRKGFAGAGFGQDEVAEVRHLLSEHATGWGVKREEDMLVLTWKGHAAVFTTAWAPN